MNTKEIVFIIENEKDFLEKLHTTFPQMTIFVGDKTVIKLK